MIAILKYNAGNIRSVANALNRLGVESILTDDPDVLNRADKVIFPGVGEAGSAMTYLQARGLNTVLKQLTQPVLGICLGLQLLGRHSEEGDTSGIGIFAERVRKFPPGAKVPHMGWNNFTTIRGPLFDGIAADEDLYFVHSYYLETGPDTTAVTEYQLPFSAAVQKDNFHAVQFHPEKSAAVGQRLLRNFLSL
ncbi:MAG: imidazole glycerol phosphate synthase subunit HisH [Candidatus Neomarinimicrobiota bacterium]